MKVKNKPKELSSPHLKELKKEFEKVQKAGEYLEIERYKIIEEKKKIMSKIKKEKEILRLKNRINFLRARKEKNKK
jgi:hypothetical protein